MRQIILILTVFFFSTNSFSQTKEPDLRITHLTGDFYVYETFSMYKGERIAANSMYLVTNDGVVLFDSPWDTTQFQPLLDTIQARHDKNVILCIATHFHSDRTAGLEYYASKGIKTFTSVMTDSMSRIKGMKRAQFLFTKDSTFTAGQYSFQTYYPGPGHAPDNIVIWFKKEKILYGGCLVKSADAENLGNMSDASITGYATSIKNVQQKSRHPKFIITGHDDWSDIRSLKHTEELAEALKKKNNLNDVKTN